MNDIGIFGFFLSMMLAISGAFTTGTTQLTLFIAAGAAAIALLLSGLVLLAGNRARTRAREEYRAIHGEYPF